ncbi:MAG: inverse autotransporter beta domain-containing protein [Simkaniaceae bacterium]
MKYLIFILFPLLCFSHEFPTSYTKLKHREHKGIGYDTGYTSLDVHFTFTEFPDFCLFANPRGHVFNDGRFAFNLGLGARYKSPNQSWVLGGNAYYDYRSETIFSPQQLAGGLELFYQTLAFRFNGYAPIGVVKKTKGRKAQVALANLQGEVEKQFVETQNVDFFAALGVYYLTGRSFKNKTFGKAWGSDLRLTAQLWKRIECVFETTYDHIYNFTFQGLLSLKIPLGEGKPTLPSPFYRSVIRSEIIPTQTIKNWE